MLIFSRFKQIVFLFFGAALMAGGLSLFSPAHAQSISPEMKQNIEDIVRDYIDDNPQILVDAINKLRQRDAERRGQRGKANLGRLRDELENSKTSPIGGNPKGDITIVEFSDYRCPFCKRMMPITDKLLKEDGNIRYVYKEFPILGPISTYASKAALGVWKMDKKKYIPFHNAVLGSRGDLTEERILGIAEDVGIDTDVLEKEINSPAIEREIRRNIEIAGTLGITGTPAYIIGKRIVPGAMSFEDLRDIVTDARKEK